LACNADGCRAEAHQEGLFWWEFIYRNAHVQSNDDDRLELISKFLHFDENTKDTYCEPPEHFKIHDMIEMPCQLI
jgi:hypothetical protein